MSKWADQFNTHPFHAVWSSLLESVEDSSIEELVDDNSVVDLARLKKIISHISSIIKNIDPDLFPFNLLGGFQANIQSCLNEINSFKSNKNPGHLTNANTAIDNVLTIAYQMPAAIFSIDGNVLSEGALKYSEAMSAYLNAYKTKIDKDISNLEVLSEKLNVDILSKEAKLLEIERELTAVKQTIQQQTTEFNTQYQSSENKREERFDKSFEKYTYKVDQEFKGLAEKSVKVLEVLLKLQDDASKVYGVTISTLQGGAYSSYANEERKIANNLRRFTGFLMLLGVAFLVLPEIHLFLADGKYTFDWTKVLGRLPLSLVIFVPAFYLARESGKHRNNEIINRRRQHILTTLDPYIELMDKTKAEEIKSHIAKTIFSEAVIEDDKSNDTGNILSQLSNLAKQLKN